MYSLLKELRARERAAARALRSGPNYLRNRVSPRLDVIYSSSTTNHLALRCKAQRREEDMAQRRLTRLLSELTQPQPVIGTLKLGDISFDIHASAAPSRLPHSENALLDAQDGFNADNLHFMLQKYLLGQDIFLLSQPGPYARRLAMTFCR